MKKTNIKKRLVSVSLILLLLVITFVSAIPDSVQAKEVRTGLMAMPVGEIISVNPVGCYGTTYDPHKGAKVKYASSDEKIATVDGNGNVTAKKGGKVVITVKSSVCVEKLTINVKAIQNRINHTKVTLGVGDTVSLKIYGNSKKIKWTSSNKKVATVSDSSTTGSIRVGKVTAKKKGTVTITAKVGNDIYKCKVKVKKTCDHNFKACLYSQCKGCYNKYYTADEKCNCIAGSRQAIDYICTKCGYIYETSYL